MKREGFVLNLLCIVLALAALAVVVWNVFTVGTVTNFLTIDSLFLTVVFTLLALVLLVNPIMSLRDAGMLPGPFKRRSAETTAEQSAATPALAGGTQAALPPARTVAATATAKRTQRTVPPDVESIVNRLKRSQENQS